MIDTHCHLDAPRFDEDRAEVVARARAAGVEALILPAVGPEGWPALRALAGAEPGLHPAFGIHPQLLPELDPAGDGARLAALEAELSRGGAVAVGECGLDGGAVEAGAPLARQLDVLRAHLALARRFRLPVLLHCLKAHEALQAFLAAEPPLPAGGVLHSWSGSAEQVAAFLPFGLHFAFAGPVTWERARKPVAAARAVPPERLLLETDAPDQCPRPHRGRNEPAFLPLVRDGLARALGATPAEVATLTTRNARALFRLP